MPGKKTMEEIRASNRERQRRYKERHGWAAKARARESMRLLRANRREALATPPVNNKPVMRDNAMPIQETYYEDMALVEGEPGVVREHARVVSRRRGVGIPEALMEPERGGGDGGIFKGMGQKGEPGVIGAPGQGSISGEEAQRTLQTLARLEELKGRQASGGLNAGVEVELEIP